MAVVDIEMRSTPNIRSMPTCDCAFSSRTADVPEPITLLHADDFLWMFMMSESRIIPFRVGYFCGAHDADCSNVISKISQVPDPVHDHVVSLVV